MSSTWKSAPWLALAAATVTLTAGCADEPVPAQSVDKVCGRLLGKEGGDVFTQLANGTTELTPTTRSEDTHVKEVAEAMKETMGDTPPVKPALKSVCTVHRPYLSGDWTDKDTIAFSFGWSRKPAPTAYNGTASFAVGPAARADSAIEPERPVTLFFPCRLPNGTEAVVAGHWIGPTLSDLSYREAQKARIRVIATAGAKMATALGCTNDPGLSPTAEIEWLDEGTEFTGTS